MKLLLAMFVTLALVETTGCGKDGTNGIDGKTGATGATATLGTPVQLCPGATVYPTTFPEVGICINNNLYAVYSANDGFLTELAPGVYNSNAVGSACSFTVLPGCIVQN